MKTFKISGVAAALTLLLVGSVAQADHDACLAEAEEIRGHSTMLICVGDGGTWPFAAIWQFQGKKGDGCDLHEKLAKQLFEKHDEPPKDRGKANGRPAEDDHGQGAAAALLDHKYESAILHLQNFQSTIEESARLNPDLDAFFGYKADGVTPYTAAERAEHWRSWAANMESRVAACMPTL